MGDVKTTWLKNIDAVNTQVYRGGDINGPKALFVGQAQNSINDLVRMFNAPVKPAGLANDFEDVQFKLQQASQQLGRAANGSQMEWSDSVGRLVQALGIVRSKVAAAAGGAAPMTRGFAISDDDEPKAPAAKAPAAAAASPRKTFNLSDEDDDPRLAKKKPASTFNVSDSDEGKTKRSGAAAATPGKYAVSSSDEAKAKKPAAASFQLSESESEFRKPAAAAPVPAAPVTVPKVKSAYAISDSDNDTAKAKATPAAPAAAAPVTVPTVKSAFAITDSDNDAPKAKAAPAAAPPAAAVTIPTAKPLYNLSDSDGEKPKLAKAAPAASAPTKTYNLTDSDADTSKAKAAPAPAPAPAAAPAPAKSAFAMSDDDMPKPKAAPAAKPAFAMSDSDNEKAKAKAAPAASKPAFTMTDSDNEKAKAKPAARPAFAMSDSDNERAKAKAAPAPAPAPAGKAPAFAMSDDDLPKSKPATKAFDLSGSESERPKAAAPVRVPSVTTTPRPAFAMSDDDDINKVDVKIPAPAPYRDEAPVAKATPRAYAMSSDEDSRKPKPAAAPELVRQPSQPTSARFAAESDKENTARATTTLPAYTPAVSDTPPFQRQPSTTDNTRRFEEPPTRTGSSTDLRTLASAKPRPMTPSGPVSIRAKTAPRPGTAPAGGRTQGKQTMLDRMNQSLVRRDRMREDMKKRMEEEENKELTFAPAINNYSKALPYEGQTFLRRMQEFDVKKREKADQSLREKQKEWQLDNPNEPRISMYSRSLVRDEPAHERLFKEAKARKDKQELAQSAELSQSMDVTTGQPLFRPQTNDNTFLLTDRVVGSPDHLYKEATKLAARKRMSEAQAAIDRYNTMNARKMTGKSMEKIHERYEREWLAMFKELDTYNCGNLDRDMLKRAFVHLGLLGGVKVREPMSPRKGEKPKPKKQEKYPLPTLTEDEERAVDALWNEIDPNSAPSLRFDKIAEFLHLVFDQSLLVPAPNMFNTPVASLSAERLARAPASAGGSANGDAEEGSQLDGGDDQSVVSSQRQDLPIYMLSLNLDNPELPPIKVMALDFAKRLRKHKGYSGAVFGIKKRPVETGDGPHKPVLDRKSQRINDQHKQPGELPRYHKLYAQSLAMRDSRNKLAEQKLERETKECKFKPTTNKDYTMQHEAGTARERIGVHEHLYKQGIATREKMAAIAKPRDQHDLAECTFVPNREFTKRRPKKTTLDDLDDEPSTIKAAHPTGYEESIERVRRARASLPHPTMTAEALAAKPPTPTTPRDHSKHLPARGKVLFHMDVTIPSQDPTHVGKRRLTLRELDEPVTMAREFAHAHGLGADETDCLLTTMIQMFREYRPEYLPPGMDLLEPPQEWDNVEYDPEAGYDEYSSPVPQGGYEDSPRVGEYEVEEQVEDALNESPYDDPAASPNGSPNRSPNASPNARLEISDDSPMRAIPFRRDAQPAGAPVPEDIADEVDLDDEAPGDDAREGREGGGVIGVDDADISMDSMGRYRVNLLEMYIEGDAVVGQTLHVREVFENGVEGPSEFRWIRTRPNGHREVVTCPFKSYTLVADDADATLQFQCRPHGWAGIEDNVTLLTDPTPPVRAATTANAPDSVSLPASQLDSPAVASTATPATTTTMTATPVVEAAVLESASAEKSAPPPAEPEPIPGRGKGVELFGSLVVGSTLSARGTAGPERAAVRWFRLGEAGAITMVALDSPTYKLTHEDVGFSIRVTYHPLDDNGKPTATRMFTTAHTVVAGKEAIKESGRKLALIDVLSDSEGVRDFMRFLGKNGHQNYLNFYLDVEFYKTIVSPDERRRTATQIFERRMRDLADPELEFSRAERQALSEQTAAAAPDLFNAIQGAVYAYMEKVWLPRFKETEHYDAFLAHRVKLAAV